VCCRGTEVLWSAGNSWETRGANGLFGRNSDASGETILRHENVCRPVKVTPEVRGLVYSGEPD
jgi:hypothetical protein